MHLYFSLEVKISCRRVAVESVAFIRLASTPGLTERRNDPSLRSGIGWFPAALAALASQRANETTVLSMPWLSVRSRNVCRLVVFSLGRWVTLHFPMYLSC